MLLELDHIYKWVTTGGRRTFLLNDLSLKVEEGELFQLWGRQVPVNLPY